MKKFDCKSQAIIMCGISGSGKTHYARHLEKEGYIRLSSDLLIWEKVGGRLFSLSKEEKGKLFKESRLQLKNQLLELLKTGNKVVVDATHCKRSVRDEMRKVCAEANVKPTFIQCQSDEPELWNRLSQRTGSGPDDLIVTRQELSEYWNGFERPQQDEFDVITAF